LYRKCTVKQHQCLCTSHAKKDQQAHTKRQEREKKRKPNTTHQPKYQSLDKWPNVHFALTKKTEKKERKKERKKRRREKEKSSAWSKKGTTEQNGERARAQP